MAAMFSYGVLAASRIFFLIWLICYFIDDHVQYLIRNARSSASSEGYNEGYQVATERMRATAIELGFAFYEPINGEFTWKVAVKTAPVDLNDALPKAE